MNSLLKILIIIFSSLLFYKCASEKPDVEKKEITGYKNVWYRQASLDLGYRILMVSSDSGVAISRGRGDVEGKVYVYNSGAWNTAHSFPYSDYPQINFYDDKLWVVNHLTHNGFFKPILTEIGKEKKQIPLPKIMWDATDYVMWQNLSILPDGTAWMAGQQGNIIYYNGNIWEERKSPVDKNKLADLISGDINDIYMLDSSSGWAVGKDGIILRYKNGLWKKHSSPTDKNLQRIVMIGEDKGWIAGFGGTVLEYKNGEWIKSSIQSPSSFYSVKAVDENHVWVCGANSSLYFFDGKKWTEDKNAEYLEESFVDLSVVKDSSGYLIWLIGSRGIYTNSQALGFSFTEHTEQSLIRPVGRSGLFIQNSDEKNPNLIVFNEEAPPLHYKNNGRGVFNEIAIESGIINSPNSAGAAVSSDFNNDGYLDFIHIFDNRKYKFFLGTNDSKFIDFTGRSNLRLDSIDAYSLTSLSAIDFNNDGNVDLYFSNDGRSDMLFKNDGAGHFQNVFDQTSLPVESSKSFGTCFSDFNNDGLIDILYPYQVPNDGKLLALYLNNGNFNFSLRGDESFNASPGKSLSTTVAVAEDFNNDGWIDIFVHHQKEAPWLLLNEGGRKFKNVSKSFGFNELIFHPEPVNGTVATSDVNNDGWIDLFISSKLYLNEHGVKFKEISQHAGINFTGNPTFADIDDDGDNDLFIGGSANPQVNKGAILYRNNLTNSNFIKVSIEGVYSNRFAEGARINLYSLKNSDTLFVNTKIIGAGNAPMLNNGVSEFIFGIEEGIEHQLEVIFPSGEIKKIENIKAGEKYFVRETNSLETAVVLTYKSLIRTFLLADKTVETIRFLIFVFLMAALIYSGKKVGAGRFVNHWYFAAGLFFVYAAVVHYSILSTGVFIFLLPFVYVIVIGGAGIYAAQTIIKKQDAEIVSHYKIEKLLGKGGMGKVYFASDVNTKQKVALKVLMPELLQDEENKFRFSNEGRLLSSFNHPNIVKVFELGESSEGGYIAMEYMPNGTLKDYLSKTFPLSLEETKRISLQICSGLEEIHSKGIVHRDMKTGNIMLDEKNDIRIMDFGLSKSPLVSTMTALGTVLGTLGYVAPEQVTNLMVDRRSDIFSMGVILYEICTNLLPFKGENEIALIHSIFNTKPPLPSSINNNLPAMFDNIIMKCLSKNPDERFQSASELGENIYLLQI